VVDGLAKEASELPHEDAEIDFSSAIAALPKEVTQ